MASKPWCLVSPASRGIGLALTRHLLLSTKVPIVATLRASPETDMKASEERFRESLDVGDAQARLYVHEADVLNESTLAQTANRISQEFPAPDYHLRLAMCVPGVLYPEKSITRVNYDKAHESFRINTLGPLLQMKHFHQFLPRKRTKMQASDDDPELKGLPSNSIFAVMSARVGSITDNKLGGWYSYRASKAGLTQLAKTFDTELQLTAGENAMCVALHPGTVRTDFTEGLRDSYEKHGKVIDPAESAEALLNVVNRLSRDQRGRFFDWKGEEIPP